MHLSQMLRYLLTFRPQKTHTCISPLTNYFMLSKGIFVLSVFWGYVTPIVDCAGSGGWVLVMIVLVLVLVIDRSEVWQGSLAFTGGTILLLSYINAQNWLSVSLVSFYQLVV